MAVSTKIVTAAQDRKKAILAVCLCLLAISVTYRLLNPYRQETAARLNFPQTARQASKTEAKEKEKSAAEFDRETRVKLFLNPPIHSGEMRRNIFQRQEKPASSQDADAAESGQAPEEDMKALVAEELSRFKTFGYMQGKNEKVLFLERGKDILLVREGDRIDGKYLVKRITEKQLVIRAESIAEDVEIDLGAF
jgi:hypothetical protein